MAPQQCEFTRHCLDDNGWVSQKYGAILSNRTNLDVADIGTGAGFIAISLAQAGHKVTATDISTKMLECANSTAKRMGLDIDFVRDDILDTRLPEGSFDLVVLRDVFYCLRDSKTAILNTVKLVRPGGFMVFVDGNYFLHLHEDEYGRRNNYFVMKHGKHEYEKMMDFSEGDYRELESLVGGYDVNKVCRPYCELDFLTRIGLNNLRISADDDEDFKVLTRDGGANVPYKYTLVAQKPIGSDMVKLDTDWFVDLPFSEDSDVPEGFSTVFEAFANPDRVRILNHLNSAQCTVHSLADQCGLTVKMTSYHLALMKKAGLVECEKEGREVIYRSADRQATAEIMKMALRICGP